MKVFLILIVNLLITFNYAHSSEWHDIEKQFKYEKNHIPPCKYGTKVDGPTIGIIGDSWLDYGINKKTHRNDGFLFFLN